MWIEFSHKNSHHVENILYQKLFETHIWLNRKFISESYVRKITMTFPLVFTNIHTKSSLLASLLPDDVKTQFIFFISLFSLITFDMLLLLSYSCLPNHREPQPKPPSLFFAWMLRNIHSAYARVRRCRLCSGKQLDSKWLSAEKALLLNFTLVECLFNYCCNMFSPKQSSQLESLFVVSFLPYMFFVA